MNSSQFLTEGVVEKVVTSLTRGAMPEYIVVRCFSCGLFGVIQKPKSSKWNCRVCNAKQSVQKEYAISFKASDLRPVVQTLNLDQGEKGLQMKQRVQQIVETVGDDQNLVDNQAQQLGGNDQAIKKTTKWMQFIQKDELNEFERENEEPSDSEKNFTTVVPQKTRKRSSNTTRVSSPVDGKSKRKRSNNDEEEVAMTKFQKTNQMDSAKSSSNISKDSPNSSLANRFKSWNSQNLTTHTDNFKIYDVQEQKTTEQKPIPTFANNNNNSHQLHLNSRNEFSKQQVPQNPTPMVPFNQNKKALQSSKIYSIYQYSAAAEEQEEYEEQEENNQDTRFTTSVQEVVEEEEIV